MNVNNLYTINYTKIWRYLFIHNNNLLNLIYSAVEIYPFLFKSSSLSIIFSALFGAGNITGLISEPSAFCKRVFPKMGTRRGPKGFTKGKGGIRGNIGGNNGKTGGINGNRGNGGGIIGGKNGGTIRGNGLGIGGNNGAFNFGSLEDRDFGFGSFIEDVFGNLKGGGFEGSFGRVIGGKVGKGFEWIFMNIGECLEYFRTDNGFESGLRSPAIRPRLMDCEMWIWNKKCSFG